MDAVHGQPSPGLNRITGDVYELRFDLRSAALIRISVLPFSFLAIRSYLHISQYIFLIIP
jgi:hypothetical protein